MKKSTILRFNQMLAPERFAEWMSKHEHRDPNYGYVYNYHPRSDAHSIALCKFILDDLLAACQVFREQAQRGEVVYGINLPFTWSSTGKSKTLDLAIGLSVLHPSLISSGEPIVKANQLAKVLFACEAKSVMTEHSKSRPRVYDELSSSHEIVHQGSQEAIAAGITVVNIAETFISPLRQKVAESPFISQHNQPQAATNMIQHLRGLPIRNKPGEVGFDAYATFVVDCDNRSPAHLWTDPPAPQPGDKDHYETFIHRISQFYTERFSVIRDE